MAWPLFFLLLFCEHVTFSMFTVLYLSSYIFGFLSFCLFPCTSVENNTCARVPHFIYVYQGKVDDFSFFDCSSTFCFLLIEFHCTFSIFYKMPQYYVYYYCILIRWYFIGTSFFVPNLLFKLTSLLSLCLFLYLISSLLFPCSSVWENTPAILRYLLLLQNVMIKMVEVSPVKN